MGVHRAGTPFRVSTDRLRPGVFVRLDGLKWYEHPFLFTSFKIHDERQIAALHEAGIREVLCVPGKSDVLPLEEEEKEKAPPPAPDPGAAERLWKVKNERAERLRRRQERIEACRKRYLTSQKTVSRVMQGIASGQAQSVAEAEAFTETLAEYFLPDAESSLYLVSLTAADENVYYHALNVAVLAMLLGQKIGLNREALKRLGLGAILHDIGKCRVDRKILLKETPLTRPEEDFLRLHPKYGVELLAARGEKIAPDALDIVLHHHERMDGSGYPDGLKGNAIDRLTRITAIADVYDNYCNRRNPADSLTPYEALATMFARQKHELDAGLLSLFIHCLGIYPPGTVIRLNNDAIGMVVAVNPKDQLHPSIVIHDPEIPPKDAPIIDLAEQPGLKIVKSIRPAALDKEVFEYLSPRTRVTYFVDSPDADTAG